MLSAPFVLVVTVAKRSWAPVSCKVSIKRERFDMILNCSSSIEPESSITKRMSADGAGISSEMSVAVALAVGLTVVKAVEVQADIARRRVHNFVFIGLSVYRAKLSGA